jgi:hypothetical protein
MDIEYLKKSIQLNDIFQKKNKKDNYISDRLLNIVEQFMINHKLICYGGTAINNILPHEKQFYDYNVDIPDYDFFSPNALEHAKELCNIYSKENVYHVEGKNAFFFGTYKVFVNFVPIADITQIHPDFYDYLLKNAISVNKILYTPASFLRMSLHQELARPLGDVSRWEKIYNRMKLLNMYYPIIIKEKKIKNKSIIKVTTKSFDTIYKKIYHFFVEHHLIFCNFNIVSCLLNTFFHKKICAKKQNDIFIMYSNDLSDTFKQLNKLKLTSIQLKKIESKYKFIHDYFSIYYKQKIIGYVFQTNSCLAYNEVTYNKKKIKLGNIDTLLSLYFSFILMDEIEINNAFIYNICGQLGDIVNIYDDILTKYSDHKIPEAIKRFNLPCYGTQDDFQHILQERNKKYKELKQNKTSQEYKKWFFKYVPTLKYKKNKSSKKVKSKKNKTKKKNS